MKSSSFGWWILVGLAALCILVWHEYRLLPDGKLHLHVLDVGQGDGILLVSPSGKQIVVDGGPDTSLLEQIGKHMPFFDRTIELLILSHPDADHITALPELLQRYTVKHVLMTGARHGSGRYAAFLHHLIAQGSTVILADPTKDIDMGDGLILDIVWPKTDVFGVKPDNANNPSVVVRALFEDQSILLAGDIEEDAEQAILMSGADLRSTILKVPHHGSRTSSSTGFLLAVQPNLAVISAGRDNRFGHPHPDVLDRYEWFNIAVRRTDLKGNISL